MTDAGRVGADYLRRAAVEAADLKAASYTALGLSPQARVLDLGCGPGVDVGALAASAGRVVGVDLDADLLAAAAQAGAAGNVVLLRADAAALPFASGSFDAVRSERMLQHVPDPAAVIAELVRVTRTGGRVVLIDTDWTSLSIGCGALDLERRVVASLLRRVARHPDAGRELLRSAAGLPLEIDSVTVHPMTSGDLGMVRGIAHLDLAEQQAVEDRAVSPEQLDRWHAALLTAAEHGTLFATINLVLLVARRR